MPKLNEVTLEILKSVHLRMCMFVYVCVYMCAYVNMCVYICVCVCI